MSLGSGARVSWLGIGLLTGAHLIHDMALGFLAVALPFLREELGFSLFLAGLLLPAQQVGSLLMPVLGNWADRLGRPQHLVVASLITTPAVMSLMGLSPSYAVLLAIVAIGGLSSAVYHPAGSALLTEYAGRRWGTALAVYHLGGNIGLALGPIAVGFVALNLGLSATPLLCLPALVWGAVSIVGLRRAGQGRSVGIGQQASSRWLKKHRRAFLALGIIILARAVGAGGLTLFLPSLLLERGHPFALVTLLASAYFLFGGVGGLLAGWLSDRVGRRLVIAATLVVTPLSIMGFLSIPGPAGLVLLLLAATAVLGEQPVIMAMIQEWAPDRRGMVVGTVLAGQFVLAGVGGLAVGWMADQFGLEGAFRVVALIPLIGVVFVRALPTGRLDVVAESESEHPTSITSGISLPRRR